MEFLTLLKFVQIVQIVQIKENCTLQKNINHLK